MTPEQFAPLWAAMLAAWPQNKPAPGAAKLYADRLAQFDADEVAQVVNALLVEEEWFPPLAKIWKACLELRTGTPGWEQAWELAIRAASSATVNQQHPVVRETIRAIGVWELRTADNPDTMRAHFRDIYQRTAKRHQRDIAFGSIPLPEPERHREVAPPEAQAAPDNVLELPPVDPEVRADVVNLMGTLGKLFTVPGESSSR